MSEANLNVAKRIPIKEGLFTLPLFPLERVRLVGSKCRNCGEVALGKQVICLNCSSEEMQQIHLNNKGKLWSYTIINYRPPGDYKGPEPFIPFGLGLVELPDGIRVESPLDCDINKIKIGMDLEFKAYDLYRDKEGNVVVAFKYRAV